MSLDTRGVQIPNGSKNPDDEQKMRDHVAARAAVEADIGGAAADIMARLYP